MLDLNALAELAVSSVRNGDEGSYSDCQLDFHSAGCSAEQTETLLRSAGWTAADAALLRLLRGHRAAKEGNDAWARTMLAQATELVGEDEVQVLLEEHRLNLTPRPVFDFATSQPHRVRHGFAH